MTAVAHDVGNELRDFHGRWSKSGGGAPGASLTHNPDVRSPDFTAPEWTAIKDYQVSWYHDVNGILRGGQAEHPNYDKRAREITKRLDKVMARSETTEDGFVYRGMRFGDPTDPEDDRPGRPAGLKPGGTFTDLGFVSTSEDDDVVRRIFADAGGAGTDAIVMKIRVPKGTKAFRMDTAAGLKGFADEKEMLLNRGLHFRIISEHPGGPDEPTIMLVEVIP